MINIINNYIFNKSFIYYLDINNRVLFICNKYRNFIINIPSKNFYIASKNKFSLLFINYFYFISIIKILFTFYNKLFQFYYFNLKLKGLGYRIRLLSKKLIKIFFNRSNYYYLYIPNTILFKYRTRRLFFISTNNIDLNLLILNLLFLKKYLVYRLSGLIYTRQILLMKPGKNKFR